jgi:hypothetical protein
VNCLLRTDLSDVNRPGVISLRAVAILAACTLFVAAEISINAVNGWWIDELYSLWASDGSQPFTRVFAERIATDSNPPLYFSVLYWVRLFIADDRMAVLTLNVAVILIAGAAVFVASKRAGLTGWALLGIAAFSLSGPVLCYVSEGRAYATAMAIVFVISWYAALSIEGFRPVNLAAFIFLAILAALTHFYAAIFCGATSAGLLALAVVARRRDLIGVGLALGLTVSVVFGAWLTLALSSVGNLNWIELSPGVIYEAAMYVRRLAVGGLPATSLLIVLLFFIILTPAIRQIFIAFGVTIALFILLPLLASLKQPIICGRYWLIGAPALVTLMVFALKAWYMEGRQLPASKFPLVAACGAVLFFATSGIYGFFTARSVVASKPIWRGAEIVRPLLDNCPAGAVRVAHGDVRAFQTGRPEDPFAIWAFSKMAKASPTLFVEVDLPTTPIVLPRTPPCAVLGWAEHVYGEDFMTRATDADLVRFLKIDASSSLIDVHRHASGFVIIEHAP